MILAWTLLAALTLPAVVLFTQHALGDRVQGNWPAVIYPAAAVAAGGLSAPDLGAHDAAGPGTRSGPHAAGVSAGGMPLLPVPAGIDPIARQLAGWDGLADRVDAIRRQAGAAFVAADDYGVAAELARALPPRVTVIGVDGRWTLTDLPRAIPAGQVGILVRSAHRGSELDEPLGGTRPRSARRRGKAAMRRSSCSSFIAS